MRYLYLSIVLLLLPMFALSQNYDIRFNRTSVNCNTRQVCYNVQIRPNGPGSFNLAGQNYRIFYNSALAGYVSGVSTLPAQYQGFTLVQDLQDVNAGAVDGPLPFEATLGFLNYAMDLNDVENGGLTLPPNQWTTTSTLCFIVEQTVIDNPNTCLEFVWARETLTDDYATAFVELSRWVSTNNTTNSTGVLYDDLSFLDGNQACFDVICDPKADDDTATAEVGIPEVIDILANDDFIPNNNPNVIGTTTITVVPGGTAQGTVVVDANTGNMTYTAIPSEESSTVTVFYQACTNGFGPLLCDQATVFITIPAYNNPPIAVDDSETTLINTPVPVDVLINDSDTDGNLVPSSVFIVSGPTHGSVTINPLTGVITYAPDLNFVGVDNFEYRVCDDGTPLPSKCDTALVTITVEQNCPVITNNIADNINPTTCSGSDGSIVLCGLISGQAGYIVTYSKNGTPQIPVTVTANPSGCATLGGLGAGSYTQISVTHPVLCPTGSNVLGPIVLVDPAPPIIAKGMTVNPSGCGFSDGSIQILGLTTGLQYTLTYSKNGMAQTPVTFTATGTSYVIQNLGSGNYTNIIITRNNCPSNVLSHVLSDPNPPVIFLSAQSSPTTCSGHDGSFTVGGLLPGTYTLTYLKNGIAQTPMNFTTVGTTYAVLGLTQGSYTGITVILNACPSNSLSATLTEPSAPVIILGAPVNPSTCSGSNGSITVSGLTTGLQYTLEYRKDGIDQTPVIFTAGGTSYTITNLEAGIYTNIRMIQAGCRSNELSQVLVDPTSPTISATVTSQPTACALNNGAITISGLTPGLSYSVHYAYNGVQQTPISILPGTSNYIISNLVAGSYSGIQVVTFGCTSNSVNLIILNPGNNYIDVFGINAITCFPGNDGKFIITGLGQGVTYTLTYRKNGILQSSITITNSPSTSYAVTGLTVGVYSDIKVTDSNGCESNVVSQQIYGPQLPNAPILSQNTLTNICPILTANLSTITASNAGGFVLSWHNDTPATTLNQVGNPSSVNPGLFYASLYNPITMCYGPTSLVTVTRANCVPDAVNDIASTNEDTPVLINPLVNDTFGGDGPSSGPITITTPPTHGTATVNNNGTPIDPTDDRINYIPNGNYNGPDAISYQICDSNGDCDIATINITVVPVNDVPDALNDIASTNEDTPVLINPLINDTFGGDGPSSGPITITTPPTHGTATVNNNGTPADPTDDRINYIPNGNYNGPDAISYQICDSNGDCDIATINITVVPVNDLPDAVNDVASTNEDTPVLINPLINDTFGGDGPSSGPITITTPPTHGTATVNNNGTPTDPTDDRINYIPNGNYNGPDAISYQICDSNGDCDIATINITVVPVNDLPDAVNDVASTNEDTPVLINPLINDTFGGDGPSSGPITITTPPTHGTATVNNNGTPTDPTDDRINYIPNGNYNGPDAISYQICDSNGDCDIATINITVVPVNDLPDAVNDVASTNEDTPVLINPLINDTFGGDGPSSGPITITTPPTNGTATVNNNGTPTDPTDDRINYIPNANYNGPDAISYQICDSNGDCDIATINITVVPVNDLPDAVNDVASTNEDTPVLINPLINDTFGGDGPSSGPITITTPPTNGTATVNNNGTPADPTDDRINYIPNANYNGPDAISYQICDSNGDCDIATINITVVPVNDLPDAVNDVASTNEDTPVLINPLINDTFGGDGPSSGPITITTPPTHGTATVNNNGTPADPTDDRINYIPNGNYNGPDAISYQICDSNGDCDIATINITVVPVNDLPDAVNDVASTNEDTPVLITPLVNDTFGGDGPSSGPITITTPPTNGTATVNNNGTPADPTDDRINYIPNGNYNGPDAISYQICDSNGDCDIATINITIVPVNDLPDAVNDVASTNEDTPVLINPLINDTFGGDGPSSGPITITTPPTHGTATVNNNGTPTDPTDDRINYIPNGNYNGPDAISYQICDSNGDCDIATINITVVPVNDLPDAVNDIASTNEDTPVLINPLINDTFGGDGPSSGPITITTPPTHGTATVNNNGTPADPTDDRINYIPNGNYNGPDAISYQICDSNGDCDIATITVNVLPVNDPPIAINDVATTPNTAPVVVPVLINDSDIDGNLVPSSVVILTPPSNGTATVNPLTGGITYTPNPNFVGVDVLVYRVCDDGTPLPSLCAQATVTITVTSSCVTPILKVMLEGPYVDNGSNSVSMSTKLNDLGYLPGQKPSTFFGIATPAGQPYSAAPWNYTGIEGNGYVFTPGVPSTYKANYPNNATDWVLVSLRESSTSSSTVCTKAALLLSNGNIQMVNGFDCCNMDLTKTYYIVVEHRNHLIVMSHVKVAVINNTITYDFTAQQSFKGVLGFGQNLINGKYVMFAGNGEQSIASSADTDINVNDKDAWLFQNGQNSSYYKNDFELNGDVNVQDKNVWLGNNGKFSDVPR